MITLASVQNKLSKILAEKARYKNIKVVELFFFIT